MTFSSSQPPRSASERVSRALRALWSRWPARLIIVGALLWSGSLLWNWVNTESEAEQQAGDTSSPMRVEGLKSFVVRKDGQRHWQITADSVAVVQNGDAWLARGVSKATLFRDDKPWLFLSAPRVRLSNLSKNLDAVGGVKATGPDQFSFSTPQARWLDRKKLVEIPGPARAQLRGMSFSAPNLSYQWDKGALSCADQVEVRAPGAVLRGSKLEANLKTRQIELGGGVELVFVPGVAKLPQ